MSNIPAFLTVDATVCSILRLTPNPDHEFNFPPGTFENIATGVVCSLDREQSLNRQYGGGLDMALQGRSDMGTWKLLTLATTDILSGDKVIVSSVSYDVKDVVPFSTHKEVILNKST